jgi:HSP20 family protein
MADQHTGGQSETEGQDQQSRGGRSSGRSTSSGANSESTQSGASGGQSSDQERLRGVSREPGRGIGLERGGGRESGSGMQRGGGRSQPSVLPAFMASPGLMASAFMANPFAFAEAMSEEMDRLFDSYGTTGQGGRELQSGSGRGQQRGQQVGLQGRRGLASWAPPMEVLQRGNQIVVRTELPGMKPDDVHIDVEDGMLTISGERQQSREDREEGYFHTERSYGTFARSIALPDNVDEEQIRARYEHGVLEVTVPIPEQQRQRGRRVQIQSGASASDEQNISASGAQSRGQASGTSSRTQQQGNQQSGTGGESRSP